MMVIFSRGIFSSSSVSIGGSRRSSGQGRVLSVTRMTTLSVLLIRSRRGGLAMGFLKLAVIASFSFSSPATSLVVRI